MDIDSDLANLLLDFIPDAMRTIRDEMRLVAAEDLTIPQFRIFRKLTKNSCTSHELADWMGVSRPTISKMVDILVERGLVKRRILEEDKRHVPLELTEKGRVMHKSIRSHVQRKLAARVSSLSAADKKKIMESMSRLAEVLP